MHFFHKSTFTSTSACNMARILLLLSLFLMATSPTSMNVLQSSSKTNAEVHYQMRSVDSLVLGPSNESLTMETKWMKRGMEQFYSSKLKIPRTFELRNLWVHFERCRDLELGCEDFQTWNITPILFCEGLKMKNQIWSNFVDSITPKTLFQNCPRVQLKQGIYKLENISIGTDAVVKYYSEAVKYYWKIQSMYYNVKNELEMRTYFQTYFVKYIKRDRANP